MQRFHAYHIPLLVLLNTYVNVGSSNAPCCIGNALNRLFEIHTTHGISNDRCFVIYIYIYFLFFFSSLVRYAQTIRTLNTDDTLARFLRADVVLVTRKVARSGYARLFLVAPYIGKDTSFYAQFQ